MDLGNIDEKIEALTDELFQTKKVNQRLAWIETQLKTLYKDLDRHKRKMQKEHEDVLKLEKKSLKKYFQHLKTNC